ncbi:MAG TPA: pitrilysin family protein [Gammaproteobacteria bacterium]|nr:pitrilysin family protein [Gammaproteobacteria bacterium]
MRVLVLAGCLLAGSSMLTAAADTLRIPPLDYRERTLANGLEVLSVEDHSSPTISVQVWYRVGSKDDPPGRSGFAHLFEHLMFKGTKHMQAEQLDRLTEDVGGSNNATTDGDVTRYYEVVPSNYLETLLWAEAERMSSLAVDEPNFKSERAVVEEEYRQSVLAQPYGLLFNAIDMRSYAVHPYRRPTIGSIADLEAATLPDVIAFHRTFYRPDNATLIVAGDFDPERLDAWVDRYFGWIPRPSTPIPAVTAAEPARRADARYTETSPSAPLPAVALTWLIPPASSRDAVALEAAAALLATGDSSRLHEALVYRAQIAQEVDVYADLRVDTGLFVAYAILASGHEPAEAEDGIRAGIERLGTQPIAAAELDKVKTQLLTDELGRRQTARGKAFALGDAALIQGDPARVNTDLEALQAVTADDVQRVLRTYVTGAHSVTIDYRPAGGADHAESATTANDRDGAADFPAKPPAPGPAPALRVPAPSAYRLDNGLRVVVARRAGAPLVTAQLLVGSGAEVEPDGKAGLADLTATLLTRGAAGMSATEIATAAEALGGSLGSGADWDQSEVGITVTTPKLAAGLALLADVVREPTFAADELERARAEAEDDLRLLLSRPSSLAQLVAGRAVFGSGAYGHSRFGTEDSLERIERADVLQLHRTYYRPDNALLVLAGDVEPDEGRALAERAFGDWPRPSAELPARPAGAAAPSTARVLVIDDAGAGQAGVVAAHAGPARDAPDWYVAAVANAVLGGSYSARLNEEIRIKRGLSYGASSRLESLRDAGLWLASAQTKNPSAAEVVDLMLEQFAALAAEPIPTAELEARKATLIGAYARSLETTEGLAGRVAELALYGIDLEELGRYIDRVQAVTADEVRGFAKERLHAEDARVVVVGDASEFEAAMKRAHADFVEIPEDELDLDSPSLEARHSSK